MDDTRQLLDLHPETSSDYRLKESRSAWKLSGSCRSSDFPTVNSRPKNFCFCLPDLSHPYSDSDPAFYVAASRQLSPVLLQKSNTQENSRQYNIHLFQCIKPKECPGPIMVRLMLSLIHRGQENENGNMHME